MRGSALGKRFVAGEPRQLFDQVDLATDVGAVRRRFDVEAIRASRLQRATDGGRAAARCARARSPGRAAPPRVRCATGHGAASIGSATTSSASATAVPCAELGDQRGGVREHAAHVGRVDAALEAMAGIGVQAGALARPAHRARIEVRALDQHALRAGVDLGVLAAHHAGERDRAFAVADQQVVSGQRCARCHRACACARRVVPDAPRCANRARGRSRTRESDGRTAARCSW